MTEPGCPPEAARPVVVRQLEQATCSVVIGSALRGLPRSQTIAALEPMLDHAERCGLKAVTVAELLDSGMRTSKQAGS